VGSRRRSARKSGARAEARVDSDLRSLVWRRVLASEDDEGSEWSASRPHGGKGGLGPYVVRWLSMTWPWPLW
jgi:hypothetical protein